MREKTAARLRPCALLAGLLAFPYHAMAFWSVEGPNHSLELGGSLRTVAAAVDNYDEPLLFGDGNDVDGLSETILRLTADGEAGTRGGYEVHLVQDIFYSTAPARTGAGSVGIATAKARYRALDLSWTWAEEEDFRAALYLDRLNGSGSGGRTDITLGRQAINFSQAYFWNPLDIFLPFDPEAFDRSYKPGVDALRADVALGPFSSLTFVAAAGNRLWIEATGEGLEVRAEEFSEEPWYGSALLGRGRTTVSHWDLTLQGGKVYGGWQAGGGFSGEVGPLGLRGEATYLWAEDEEAGVPDPVRAVTPIDDHAKAVVGADHRFENSLYINAEYFFNGAGEKDNLALALARVAVGETTNLGEHYLGLQTSYELHPLLTGQIAWIHSFSDGSDLLSPTFSWSVSNEADCIFGANLGFGDRPAVRRGEDGRETLELQSEFGSYPHTYFAELIFYF